MRKFDFKSILVGLGIGVIGVSILFISAEKISAIREKKTMAAPVTEEKKMASISDEKNKVVAAEEGIKSASINNSKVYFNGNEINLKKPLVTVVKDENSEAQLYMPMDELLEYMHFKVEWNSKDNAVYLTMNGQNNQENLEGTADIPQNEADSKAIEIMQNTGNWGYIENYLPHMSDDGIKKVVEIYNSKHINQSEHKKATDYIKN